MRRAESPSDDLRLAHDVAPAGSRDRPSADRRLPAPPSDRPTISLSTTLALLLALALRILFDRSDGVPPSSCPRCPPAPTRWTSARPVSVAGRQPAPLVSSPPPAAPSPAAQARNASLPQFPCAERCRLPDLSRASCPCLWLAAEPACADAQPSERRPPQALKSALLTATRVTLVMLPFVWRWRSALAEIAPARSRTTAC